MMNNLIRIKNTKRKNIIIGILFTCAFCGIIAATIQVILNETSSSTKAKRILKKNPLIDGHNDLSYMIRENFQNIFKRFDLNDLQKLDKTDLQGTNGVTHTDLQRLAKGNIGGQFWAAYAGCDSSGKDALRIHVEQIDTIKRFIKKHKDFFEFSTSVDEIKKAFDQGKIASLIGIESGHAIDSSLAILRIFYALGVRYMTLTHNCNVPWATNNLVDRLSNASAYGGLTDFGRKVIREMNRLGMMVDLSHVSHQTMLDALEESKAPVIFSHSSVYSLCNHTRNVRDDVLLKLKQNNGIVMINFYNGFVACDPVNAVLSDVVDHLNYVKKLIGIDQIGIGGDYDGVPETPVDLEDVSKYPNLVKKLLDINWTEEEIIKLIGGNLLRVLSDVEKHAKNSKNPRPLDDIISPHDLPNEHKKCRTSF